MAFGRAAARLALRNLPRRRTQAVLASLGIMLASLLFSTAFTTNDTLAAALRAAAVRDLGEVDVVLAAEPPDHRAAPAGGPPRYLDQSVVGRVRGRLAGVPQVEGVAPLLLATAAVQAPRSGLSEPALPAVGVEQAAMRGFDRLTDAAGRVLDPRSLPDGQAYLSQVAARRLEARPGDPLRLFLGGHAAATVTVAGVYAGGAAPAPPASMVLPLPRLQALLGEPGTISQVIITHRGPAISGARDSGATVAALSELARSEGLRVEPVKQDALDRAEETGRTLSDLFLLFGQLAIVAGMLLIFLIVAMLAAERRRELGILRAIGMRRGRLVLVLGLEGAAHALVASAAGVLLGVLAGWTMARLLGPVVAPGPAAEELAIPFTVTTQSMVAAFGLGAGLTLLVFVLAAVWVSRLDIVQAIRGLPESPPRRRARLLAAAATLAAGGLLAWQGRVSAQAGAFLLGLSLLLVCAALLARAAGLPDRPVVTVTGLAVLGLWLLPLDFLTSGLQEGIDLFFLSGVAIVAAGVWVLVVNADLARAALERLSATGGPATPSTRIAAAYSLRNRLRAGMTLAMFGLVVFTLVTTMFVSAALAGMYQRPDRIAGGFDLRVDAAPGRDAAGLRRSLLEAPQPGPGAVTAMAGVAYLPVSARQAGQDQAADLVLWGVDPGFASARYRLALAAPGYGSEPEVWEALQRQPGTAVLSGDLLPARSGVVVGIGDRPRLRLRGVDPDAGRLPDDLVVRVTEATTGRARDLRVIGVLERGAAYVGEVVTGQQTLDALAGRRVRPQSWFVALAPGVDAAAAARSIERRQLPAAVQVTVLAEEIRRRAAANLILQRLLAGFLGFGLLVGIAALGVVVGRSVVERRQQIAVLRSIGFQRRGVGLAFLLEAMLLASAGIGLGLVLGVALSRNVIRFLRQDLPAIPYQVPWAGLLAVLVLCGGAALLAAYLPARRAARVYPADALRHEA